MPRDLSSSGGRLFVSQALLDAWVGHGRVEVEGSSLALVGDLGRPRRYELEPAVRFLRVSGSAEDLHALVARVKTLEQVRDLGGEVLADSVVVGEVAYEVEPGFLAEAAAVAAASRAAPVPPSRDAATPPVRAAPSAKGPVADQGRALPADLEDRRKEAEALARFLLDNLS
jgi:hypothetical protein